MVKSYQACLKIAQNRKSKIPNPKPFFVSLRRRKKYEQKRKSFNGDERRY